MLQAVSLFPLSLYCFHSNRWSPGVVPLEFRAGERISWGFENFLFVFQLTVLFPSFNRWQWTHHGHDVIIQSVCVRIIWINTSSSFTQKFCDAETTGEQHPGIVLFLADHRLIIIITNHSYSNSFSHLNDGSVAVKTVTNRTIQTLRSFMLHPANTRNFQSNHRAVEWLVFPPGSSEQGFQDSLPLFDSAVGS